MYILSRPFGTTSAPVTLAFRRTPLDYDKNLNVMFMTPPDKHGPLFGPEASLTLLPSQLRASGTVTSAVLPDGSARLSLFSVEGDVVDGIGSAAAMTVAVKGLPSVTVAPTATVAALRALEQCEHDVALRWGVPEAELAALGTPPKPGNVLAVFGPGAYPPESIQHGEQGRVTTLLSLDSKGKVKDCVVKASSGYASLDRVSCALSSRMAYSPALDKQGMPMASHAGLRVNWILPGRPPKAR